MAEDDPPLSAFQMLQGADPVLLSYAETKADWRDYHPGEVVIDAGDAIRNVLFLVHGNARAVVRTILGDELIIGEFSTGSFFADIPEADNGSHLVNITALTKSRFCCLPFVVFLEVAQRSPEVGLRLLRVMSKRTRQLQERLVEMVALSMRDRLYNELLRMSRLNSAGQRVISPRPQHTILAARIGARREDVSRRLSAMTRSGLLKATRYSFVLPHPDRLNTPVPPSPSA